MVRKASENSVLFKPILEGKDIRKYRYENSELYLINTHNGSKKDDIPPINVKQNYPVIYEYLNSFGNSIKHRSDQGVHWTNLRNCAYLNEFEKPKLIWGNLNQYATFTVDLSGVFINAPANFLTAKSRDISIAYLGAVLNSKLTTLLMRKIGYERRGGYVEYKKVFVEQLPIPQINIERERPFEILVSYILFLYELGEKEPINEFVPNKHIVEVFEEVIDAMVLELYFEEDFKRENLSFIEYAIRDFVALEKSDDVKDRKEIVHASYQKLREDKNEIRNNLKLMGIRLKELVNTINTV